MIPINSYIFHHSVFCQMSPIIPIFNASREKIFSISDGIAICEGKLR